MMATRLPDVNDFISPLKLATPEEGLKSYLESHAYADNLIMPADESVLFYNGLRIGSRGNIVAINGRAKSRKSVIASAMMSASYSNEFLGFSTAFGPSPTVLHFDTEQGYGHWLEGCRRVIRDAGLYAKPAGYHSYHTRESPPEERVELLGYALGLHKPDLVIVDGVTDLVYDLNSQEEATRIGSRLMAWSVEFNCLIVVIIHVTKGNSHMTGAVGTYIEKKCQTALTCEKDEDDLAVSWVKCQYSRDEPFTPFGIQYNKDIGRYDRIDEREVLQSGPGANNAPETKSEEFRAQFLNAIFRLHSSYKNDHLFKTEGITRAAAHMSMGKLHSKDVTAWLTYFKSSGLIDVHPDHGFMRSERIQAARAASPEFDFIGDDGPNPADDLPF